MDNQQKDNLLPTKELHSSVVDKFAARLGTGCDTVRILRAADEIVADGIPMFTLPQLVWIQALITTTQANAPITEGFSQEQLMEYARRIGCYNGMLDMLVYVAEIVETNQVTTGN